MIDFSTLGDYQLPSEEARLMARALRERFPTLRLVRLDPGDPDFTEHRPYAVIDTEPLTINRVLRVFPASLLNSRGLAEIIDIRARQYGGMTPNRYWALKASEQTLKAQERQERLDEKLDVVRAFLGSSRHRFQYHDGDSGDTIVIRK